MAIITRITLSDASNKLIHGYKDMCLGMFGQNLKNLQLKENKPRYARFWWNFDTVSDRVSKPSQLKWILGASKLWHFKKLFPDPEKIVTEQAITYDLDKTNGFDFYCSLSWLRYLESYPTYFCSAKGREMLTDFSEAKSADIAGKVLLDADVADWMNDGHGIIGDQFNTEFNETPHFNKLKTIPNSVPLSEYPYWNYQKRATGHMSQYYAQVQFSRKNTE